MLYKKINSIFKMLVKIDNDLSYTNPPSNPILGEDSYNGYYRPTTFVAP